jgi:rhomboid protease GluP
VIDSPSASDNNPTGEVRQPPPPQQTVRISLPQSAPYVTYTLIGVTVFVFVLQVLSLFVFGRDSQGADILEHYGALVGSAVHQGQVWRLITPILLHDNSFPFFHILFNMYALYVLGIGIERTFGPRRYVLLYLLGGFSGNVISFLHSGAYTYSIGASTAIFGLIGAEGIFLIQNRKLFADRFRGAIGNVIFVIVINLFVIGSLPFIDNWGHIGGLFGGLMFTWFAGPIWGVESNLFGGYTLVDKRPARDVITGAVVVAFIFGALTLWGMSG